MKHPALARVFSIVLAVLCLVMLIAGVSGVQTVMTDKQRSDETIALLRSRTEEAQQLQTLLADEPSYKEQSEALEKAKEQHESDSAQHRTDLATYSATRGGTKMGADKLWEAQDQVTGGRAQLEQAMQQLQTGEAAYAAYQSALGLAGACSAYAAETGAARQILEIAAAEAAAATDPTAAGAIMLQAQSDAAAAMPNSASYNGTKDASVALLTQVAAMAGIPFDASLVPADVSVSVNVADMPGTLRQIYTANGTFGMLAQGLTQFTSNSGMDASTGTTLAESRAQLEAALAKLDAGEKEIKDNLAQIWYTNGELKKDAVDLEERKTELADENARLIEQEARAEKQKTNENRYKSLCILLKANDGVSAAVEQGGELIESARLEADRQSAEAEKDFTVRLAICALSVLGAVCGFAGIPAAFEKSKSRVLLILPVLMCLLCAVCAVALNLYIARGALYSVLFTIPFALIQLLIVIPKKKVY